MDERRSKKSLRFWGVTAAVCAVLTLIFALAGDVFSGPVAWLLGRLLPVGLFVSLWMMLWRVIKPLVLK